MIHHLLQFAGGLSKAVALFGLAFTLAYPALGQAEDGSGRPSSDFGWFGKGGSGIQFIEAPKGEFFYNPVVGKWWVKTLYDTSGTPIWQGGQTDQSLTLDVQLDNTFSSQLDCNGLFGRFEEAQVDGSISLSEDSMMTTLMGCFGDYPPAIRFSDIARFERTGIELVFFDDAGRPVASLYNVHGLYEELRNVLGIGLAAAQDDTPVMAF